MDVLKSFLAAILMLTLHACTNKVAQTPKQDQTAVATPAALKEAPAAKALPSFTVLDVVGNKVDIQQFKGKKVLVNLWATWCPPCRAEMPSIAKLYQGVDTSKVQFVMVTLDNDFETAKQYVQKKSLALPVFYPAGDVPELFAVNGIPTTFIFDESGALIAHSEGSENYNTPEYRKLFGVTD